MTERDFERLIVDDAMDYENGFYWHSPVSRLAKLCAQYELYKQITGLAGDILETGVFKASTLIRLASFRHFFETAESRKIYAFDAFGAFPQKKVSRQEDFAYAAGYDNNFGCGLSVDEVVTILTAKGLEQNVCCIAGDISDTMPLFFEKNPNVRLAFVHVDVEVYEPTRTILECCWERIVPGGIMALDDFNGTTGAGKAISEFFGCLGGITFQKKPFADAPTYVVKR